MSLIGKILGGGAGFLVGGPVGAVAGAAMGHLWFDQAAAEGLDREQRSQFAFFIAVFWVMGHISKADGAVSREEIDFRQSLMEMMELDAEESDLALNLFADGSDSPVILDKFLDHLIEECTDPRLIEAFVNIQIETAKADGNVHPRERSILEYIQHRLGLPSGTVDAILQAESGAPSTDWAYSVLELEEGCSGEEIKRAYKRLMNRYHPDKLVSKDLPEEIIRIANEKTRQIKAAYERLRQAGKTR